MILKERANTRNVFDTYGEGSVFRLCDGENLCPEPSIFCEFKARICVVNDDANQTLSEIRFDTVHG